MKTTYRFPKHFLWGVATAATQIEGAAKKDGKGESIWDRFAATKGKTFRGETPAVACDHYHRYVRDFALMERLGIRHYRMSVAWPRIFPTGRGRTNEKGLDFYDRLIDSALKHGITPWVTMYHWDLPQSLEDEGGWRVRSTPEAFANYARTVVGRLGDRVKNWMTLNELPSFIGAGYQLGVHAPGAKERRKIVNQCFHHALLAHGFAVSAVREHGSRGARVGFVHNADNTVPVTEEAPDIAAARAEFARRNAQLMGPVFLGRYPASFLRAAGRDAPVVAKGDLAMIGQRTDFFALNIYTADFVRAGRNGTPETLPHPKGYPQGTIWWLRIVPQTAYWSVRFSREAFDVPPIAITENGVCYDDEVNQTGEILDLGRIQYYRQYLCQLHRAIGEGFPVRGFFAWSFMDNYEWAEGYSKRFGLVYVDYATRKRIPKLSAHWYRRCIHSHQVL